MIDRIKKEVEQDFDSKIEEWHREHKQYYTHGLATHLGLSQSEYTKYMLDGTIPTRFYWKKIREKI